MSRRDFARRCFWTAHPLCQLAAFAYGYWDNGAFHRCGDFTLKQLIEFTEALPEESFKRLAGHSHPQPQAA